MSVVPAFTDGRLAIMGDSASNTILISSVDVGGVPHVTVNGLRVGSGVKAADVTSIYADLGGGHDTMDLSTLDLVTFSGLSDRSVTILGGAGQDKLIGTSLAEILNGGAGNDELQGLAGDDELDGGGGVDAMYGGDGNDQMFGRGGLDVLFGGNGDDDLRGGADSDRIFGEAGKDTVRGQDGDDFLYGGDDNDRLIGNNGSDLLAGGAGNDGFVFPDPDDSGIDTIDEVAGEGRDRINVSQLTLATPVNLDSTAVQQLTANQSLRLLNPGTVEKVLTGNTIGPSSEGVYTVPGASGATTPVTFRYGGGNTPLANSLYAYEVDADGYPIHTLYPPDDPLFDPLVPIGDLTIKGLVDDASIPIFFERPYPAGTRLAFYLDRLDAAGSGLSRFYSMPTMNEDGEHARTSSGTAGETLFSWEDLSRTQPNPMGLQFDGDFDDVILGVGTLTTDNEPVWIRIEPGARAVAEDGSESLSFTFTNMADDGVNPPYPDPVPRDLVVGFADRPAGYHYWPRTVTTALPGEDYSGLPGNNGTHIIVIPAGESSVSLTLPLINDDFVEGDETVALYSVWAKPDSFVVPDEFLGITTILDDDKVDLDVDSDNTGLIERSAYEESLEQAGGQPGVLLGTRREPIVVEIGPGRTASLTLGDGAEKIAVWSSATDGTMLLSVAQPTLELTAPAGPSSTEWTFWIEAIAASQSDGDISIALVPADEPANSPLVDIVRATSLLNHAPEFQSEQSSPDTGEDFYSFSVTSDLVGVAGSVEATDEDGDLLEYSGESDALVVNADGTIEVRPGVMLLPGRYEVRAMAQDPRGEFDFADVEIVVSAPDFGFTITGLANAVEGADLGRFQIWRSDASSSLDVVLELVAAPVTVPVGLDDFVITRGNETLSGPFFTIHLEPGEQSPDLFVTAFEDSLPELIEDLSLRVYSYTVGAATASVAAFNVLATIMLVDAVLPEDNQWQVIGDGTRYRAVHDNASLKALAMMVTINEDDWTSIWPLKGSDLGLWRRDGDFSTSPQEGAVADVSNLLGKNSVRLVMFGVDTVPGPDSAFVKGGKKFFLDYIKEKDAEGKRRTVAVNPVGNPESLARTLKRFSSQGKTPLSEVLFVGHWLREPMAAENVPDEFLNWNAQADVALNGNTFEFAKKGIGPVRGWFTRNASFRFFACNTDGLVERWAAEFLPVGATAYGTTAYSFCGVDRAGFDQDGNGKFDPGTGEDKWTNAADLFGTPEWRQHAGGQ